MGKEYKSLDRKPTKGKPNNKPNYIKQQIQSFGPNFLDTRSAFELTRDAQRIIRDLAKGNININEYAQYLSNGPLLYHMLKIACDRRNEEEVIKCGILTMITQLQINGAPIDPFIQMQFEKHNNKYLAYNILYTELNNFNATQDPRYLITLVTNIYTYARYID